MSVDERIHARPSGKIVREMAFRALLGRYPRDECPQVRPGDHTERPDAFEQAVQHVRGGAGIGECPMNGCDGRVEVLGERGQFAVAHFARVQRHTREPSGIQRPSRKPRQIVACACGFEEPEIVGSVVGNEDRVTGELAEGRHSTGHRWCIAQHAGRYARHRLNVGGDVSVGVDQGGELSQGLAAADFDGSDLCDAGFGRWAAGCLEIDDDERHRRQRLLSGQLIQRQLAGSHHSLGDRHLYAR